MFGALTATPRSSHEGFGVRRALLKSSNWSRALCLGVPFVLLLNYLVIFHWSFLENLGQRIIPFTAGGSRPWKQPASSSDEAEKVDSLDYWTSDTHTQFSHGNFTTNTTTGYCNSFPSHLLSSIQVVLKVGVADDWARRDAQLSSVIKCIPNVLIVSDANHSYGPHNASDVLAPLPAIEYMKDEDYLVYAHQKNTTQENLQQGSDGWRIDKYKFLPAVEEAVNVNPNANWYVFIESDTYIFWDNLFRLLDQYDSGEPHYFGSPSPGKTYQEGKNEEVKKVWFAYGGCGYVLSSPAASALVNRPRNVIGMKGIRVTDQYRTEIQADCCGDSILGWALHDKAQVEISGLWPMFNPHPLHGVPFGKKYWCEPVVSLHKSDAEDFVKLWAWENQRKREGGPLLYRDLLAYHRLGEIEKLEDWDNADFDGYDHENGHAAHESFDACTAECRLDEHCYQFTYHAAHCWMSKAIRLGHRKNPDGQHEPEQRRYISGWDVQKIRRWVDENTCEDGAHWVKPSIKRIF